MDGRWVHYAPLETPDQRTDQERLRAKLAYRTKRDNAQERRILKESEKNRLAREERERISSNKRHLPFLTY